MGLQIMCSKQDIPETVSVEDLIKTFEAVQPPRDPNGELH